MVVHLYVVLGDTVPLAIASYLSLLISHKEHVEQLRAAQTFLAGTEEQIRRELSL